MPSCTHRKMYEQLFLLLFGLSCKVRRGATGMPMLNGNQLFVQAVLQLSTLYSRSDRGVYCVFAAQLKRSCSFLALIRIQLPYLICRRFYKRLILLAALCCAHVLDIAVYEPFSGTSGLHKDSVVMHISHDNPVCYLV